MKSIIAICLLCFCFIATANADEIGSMLDNVKKYVQEANYPKALEELSWVKREIDKLNSGSIVSLLPDTIEGYQGEKAKTETAMGIKNIEREYVKGEKTVKLSITDMGSGGTGGGLAGFGKMAAMMGGNENVVRVSGRTAMVEESENLTEITLFLDGGAVLKLETREGGALALLKKFAETLDIAKLDSYMQGK